MPSGPDSKSEDGSQTTQTSMEWEEFESFTSPPGTPQFVLPSQKPGAGPSLFSAPIVDAVANFSLGVASTIVQSTISAPLMITPVGPAMQHYAAYEQYKSGGGLAALNVFNPISAFADNAFKAYDGYKWGDAFELGQSGSAVALDVVGLVAGGGEAADAWGEAPGFSKMRWEFREQYQMGTAVMNGLLPLLKGAAGEQLSVAEARAMGETPLGPQVTFELPSGRRTRADLLTETPGGTLKIREAKNGPSARLTKGQMEMKQAVQAGIPVIPRGGNAEAAGLTPGTPVQIGDFEEDRY